MKVLKFGDDKTSYIEYSPDMNPFKEAMSICAWVKKLRPGGNTIWFGYCSNKEIVISDNGYWNGWFGNYQYWTDRVTVELGEWYHHCTTWGLSSKTRIVFYHGNIIGTASREPERTSVLMNGVLVIGNDCNGSGGNNGGTAGYPFGGELIKLNVFSKELSAREVKAMSDAGIGSKIEETHGADRKIRWEDILLKQRTGNVKEIQIQITGKLVYEFHNATTLLIGIALV